MAKSPTELARELETRVEEPRRTGDAAAILSAVRGAVDEIERHANGDYSDDTKREALMAIQRLSFNAAADCWPGWSVPAEPAEARDLEPARELAQFSLGLVDKLGFGPIRQGTGTWLVGAFDLALGRYAEASKTFATARDYYLAAPAPGLVLLVEGYIAIAHQVAGGAGPADGGDLDQVFARIAAGKFEDGDEWIAQLRTALLVFAR
jgi:hypothetical protein